MRRLEIVEKPDGGTQVVEVLAEFTHASHEVNMDAARDTCATLERLEMRYERVPVVEKLPKFIADD